MSENSSIQNSTRKREWIVVLLLLSCLFAAILLWKAEPYPDKRLTSTAQLDSLITLRFEEFGISQQRLRTRTVAIDSVFSRKIYTARVSSDFSKTFFHYNLHKDLIPYSVKTHGVVQFPEKHLRIHLLYNNTVHRSLFLQTDPLLNLTSDP